MARISFMSRAGSWEPGRLKAALVNWRSCSSLTLGHCDGSMYLGGAMWAPRCGPVLISTSAATRSGRCSARAVAAAPPLE